MLRISVKVTPNAKETKIIMDSSARICIYIKSSPQKGKANLEVVDFLSKKLSIAKNKVNIISGLTSRYKTILIDKPLTFDELLSKLNLEVQGKVNI